MTGRVSTILVAILSVAVIVITLSGTFVVEQTEQALVLRFGEPVAGRGLVTEPGLHFKIPFIENVIDIDKRILNLETPNQEVLASDNTRIQVDAFLRYRIVDPLTFYQTIQTVQQANNQLGYIMNSAIRRVLGEADLTQIVRDDRAALMGKIREQVNTETQRLGIDAIDVRIRRADLPRQISEQVFGRMNSERAREAAEYRARGSQDKQTIEAKADRDVVVLLGDAQRQADQLRGDGDAVRNKIFAEAYGRDPAFFAFYRSMAAYDTAFKGVETRFVVSPTSDFFRFFRSPDGRPAATPPHGGAVSGGHANAIDRAPAGIWFAETGVGETTMGDAVSTRLVLQERLFMKRSDVTEKILDIKREKGWTWKYVAGEIGGMSEVLVVGALLGQMKLTKPLCEKAAELFGLNDSEKRLLNEVPMRGMPMPPTDPLIYRFYELVMVNGPAWKALIEEEFGDGIMSAIDFDMTLERLPDPKGDRVKIGMSGKFLPYRYYGAVGNHQALGYKEE